MDQWWEGTVSTRSGDRIIVAFDASHGLQNTDFNSGAFLALEEGLFVFGGIVDLTFLTP